MQQQPSEQDLTNFGILMQNTLNHENNVRVKAEQDLKLMEKQPGFVMLLLTFISKQLTNKFMGAQSAIILKNLVKRDWDVGLILKNEDKEIIKSGVVDIMIRSDLTIQEILSEVITIISLHDFYKNWTTLLPYLVNLLKTNTDKFESTRGVLATCHSLFKKYREQAKSDEIEDELIYIMKEFAEPMLGLFQHFISLVPQITDPASLKSIFTCINLLLEIYYSLNWIDIPEFFEDHLPEYSNIFLFLLNYQNSSLDNNLYEEPSLLDTAQSLVFQSINLYLEKYDEAFIPYVENFATATWQLISKLDMKIKYDNLVSKALEFLTVTSRSEKHIIFKDALPAICENIIIPNISLREEDEIIFSEEPIEYIRRDIEGSDSDSRRKSASELIKTLKPVVLSYAAWCIERLLTVKEDNGKPRYSQVEILPYAQTLLQGLFSALDNTEENEYIMKAIMRATAVLKEQMKPIMPAYISKITSVLSEVCKNPNNPMFNHYLFESYATVIKFNSDYISEFEASLFPPFQTILNQGIEEFTPYVFQLISQLLTVRQAPLPAIYISLFPNFLQAHLWESEGNIPGLVAFTSTLITKAPQELGKNNQLEQVLGIFQTLVKSNTKDYHGFRILDSIIHALPYETVANFLQGIFFVLFGRLQSKKTGQFLRCLILFFSNFAVRYGADKLIQAINQIQANIFSQLAKAVWQSSLRKVTGKIEKKVCAVALIKILFNTDLIQSSADTWKMLISELALFLNPTTDSKNEFDEDDEQHDDEETVLQTEKGISGGYKVTFTKLSFAAMGIEDPVREVQNTRLHFCQSLTNFISPLDPQQVQFVKSLIVSNPESAQAILVLMQNNGFSTSFLQ
ncbi:exportin-2 [Naegleria gruberi]|uniref:Exportin-2 n=1 Tax=Naegleria gruberi TaxID=5762 RepID=D2VCY6_NAEGR|nr:exportin-2 [Naegleria gruberi]EFC45385.1 exportin-2 [Naegleria gruberi]|eukprot:XP_002678129.1 exportin-2 [Naegleria gruberi]